jgi:ABC-2 type transport system permease protein
MLQGIKAIIVKDLKITLRNPSLFILGIIVPVVFVFLYSLITQLSATNPVVIARESSGPYSTRLIHILEEMKSVDGPYFIVKTTNAKAAFDQYNSGKAAALIQIPKAFDDRLANPEAAAKVNLYVHNINSDATKNFQIRLSHASYLFEKELNEQNVIKIVEEHRKFPQDVSMKLYISIGLLMFSAVYSSMVNTGILLSREWEERTSKEIILTSIGFFPLVAGKWATAFIQTIISVLLVLLIMSITLSFPVLQIDSILWFWIIILFFFGAGLGALLGVLLRKSMPVITLSAITGIFLYLICGNESSIRGFAYGGAVEILWSISNLIPVSYIVENMRRTFLETGTPYEFTGLFSILVLIFVFSWASIWRLKRNLSFSQGQ